jgi:hypothetical protein
MTQHAPALYALQFLNNRWQMVSQETQSSCGITFDRQALDPDGFRNGVRRGGDKSGPARGETRAGLRA